MVLSVTSSLFYVLIAAFLFFRTCASPTSDGLSHLFHSVSPTSQHRVRFRGSGPAAAKEHRTSLTQRGSVSGFGLTLSICLATLPCSGDRQCLAYINGMPDGPCLFTSSCLCFPKDFQYCQSSSECIEGEVCGYVLSSIRPVCASKIATIRKVSELSRIPRAGLTLDACEGDDTCQGDRSCRFFEEKGASSCSGRKTCFCVPPSFSFCFLSSDCESGELCANNPISATAICASEKAAKILPSLSEVRRRGDSKGFTLDSCKMNADCNGDRVCTLFRAGSVNGACVGSSPCACWPRESCSATSDCQSQNDICAQTPFSGRPKCVSFDALENYPRFIKPLLVVDTCTVEIDQDRPRKVLSRQSNIHGDTVSSDKQHSAWDSGDPKIHLQLQAASKIVGGKFASPNLVPYLVAIYKRKGTTFLCSGTLISPRWVLTAAHCEIRRNFVVALGSTQALKNGVLFTVRRAFNHPKYEKNEVFDIAVLELERGPLPNSNFMKINEEANIPVDNSFARGLGYGSISSDAKLPEDKLFALRQVDLPITPHEVCNAAYMNALLETISQTRQICAGPKRGGCDTCQGDSGGPLLYYRRGNPMIVGITSFGNGCGEPKFPGVYTRVSAFISWLKSTPAIFYTDSGVFGEDTAACSVGEFVFTVSNTVKFCRECPPNQISQGGSTEKCQMCPDGLVRDTRNGRKCTCEGALAVGRGLRNGKCVLCRPGSFSGEKHSICKLCPPGKFAKRTGSEKCSKCPKDTFADMGGSSSCKKCPKGTSSRRGASSCSRM